MSYFARAVFIAAAILSTAFVGCNVFNDGGPFETFDAAVRVNVTDDSTSSLASAEVVFSRVTLVGAGEGGPVVDLVAPQHAPPHFDLVRLQGDLEAMLAEADVPAGSYAKLSVVLDGARVRLAPGLTFPDGSVERDIEPEGGRARFVDVRLEAPVDAQPDSLALLVVDFGVRDSFLIERDPIDPSVVKSVRLVPKLNETRRHDLPLD